MVQLEHAVQSSSPARTRSRLKGAFSIISIEMWERFSFYGMQALLAYYLYFEVAEGGLGLEKTQATALVGVYGALLYLCCWAGGWVSDRILGSEKTLLTGAILVSIGHAALSLIGGGAGLTIGLAAIAVGSGFVKTSAITVLGARGAEEEGSTKTDSAFQLFYLGINVGALLGPLLTGWLATRYSFGAGFGAAAVLMIGGLGIYAALRSSMLGSFEPEVRARLLTPQQPVGKKEAALSTGAVATLGAIVLYLLVSQTISAGQVAQLLLVATILAAIWLIVRPLQHPDVSAPEKHKVLAFIPIFTCSTAFWTVQAQTYGVLAVYAQERVDRMWGDFEVPAAWSQSLNPFFILALSVPLSLWLARSSRAPKTSVRISLGVIIAGSGLLMLIPFADADKAALWVLPLSIFLISFGELCIGPGGMAATAQHAPRAFATRFSALYFLTLAIGMSLAGSLSTFYDVDNRATEVRYFGCFAAVIIAIGVGTWLFSAKRSVNA